MQSTSTQNSPNFEIWKRVAQEQYPNRPDNTYYTLWQQAASDWGDNRDTNVARLFEQYVLLKNLMQPQGARDGN